jgi:hypothetical protein
MRVARLIIYEGPESWIKMTLERSLLTGETSVGPGRTITALPVDPQVDDEDLMIGALRVYDHCRFGKVDKPEGGDA